MKKELSSKKEVEHLDNEKVSSIINEDSNIQQLSNLTSLNNSFEDTFNFAFRKNLKVEQSNLESA